MQHEEVSVGNTLIHGWEAREIHMDFANAKDTASLISIWSLLNRIKLTFSFVGKT
nr:MAG TPA: hypothetical protein [Caudoviricetes sp.]